ncbi:hypothetical protein MKW94_028788, partial [Papaver nudicaule]|nr:hypothetical protein [Papaver nudicaule]
CINAVIAGCEFVRFEREQQQSQSLSNGHVEDTRESDINNHLLVEGNIKFAMHVFVKCASGIILDSSNDSN